MNGETENQGSFACLTRQPYTGVLGVAVRGYEGNEAREDWSWLMSSHELLLRN